MFIPAILKTNGQHQEIWVKSEDNYKTWDDARLAADKLSEENEPSMMLGCSYNSYESVVIDEHNNILD